MSDSDFNQLVKEVTDLVDKMAELSYTTAEHHPYWKLLYSCVEISKIVLERWDDELTKEDLSEIRWIISELENSCSKLEDKLKKVVFPVFVLPIRPIFIGIIKKMSSIYLSLLYYSTFHLLIYSMNYVIQKSSIGSQMHLQ